MGKPNLFILAYSQDKNRLELRFVLLKKIAIYSINNNIVIMISIWTLNKFCHNHAALISDTITVVYISSIYSTVLQVL